MINKVQSAKCKVQNKGFTLIELLVVISVIGILASLILARFGTVEKSARDARRKSDLNQYRTALENYAIKTNGLYPGCNASSAGDASGSLCTALGTTYISLCPKDPRQDDTIYLYRYQSNGDGTSNPTATQYILWAYLESDSTNPYLYICSSGKMAQKQNAPVTSNCW